MKSVIRMLGLHPKLLGHRSVYDQVRSRVVGGIDVDEVALAVAPRKRRDEFGKEGG